MALARIKTWSSGEVLTASDLNSEFNNILNNAFSLISPLTGAIDMDGFSIVLDGAGVTSMTSSAATGLSFTTGAKSGTPGTTGATANFSAYTFTDTATAGSGTATAFTGLAIQRPTLAASNSSVVTTDAATLYIPNSPAAGTNETITNAYALWTDDGRVRLDLTAGVVSAAGATLDAMNLPAVTATISGGTNITTATGVNFVTVGRPTLSAASALTITNAATLYISNSPLGAGAGPATITNAYSLWVDDGAARFDGAVTVIDGSFNVLGSSDATKKLQFEVDGFTTATTRTATFPDASGTVLLDTGGQNWNSRLVNGNWLIDQINEGALYTYSGTSAVGPDGWSGSATGAGVFKLRTLADPDNAALKCLEITCTTADASIAATDNYFIFTAVEGYDAADLQSGISTAAPITIRFKFKTNITGVYGISVANSATNRSYVSIITVANSSENEYTTTLTLDTAGTWLYTNGVGLYMRISLSSGGNFQTTAGAWAGSNMFTTSAQCNFMSANTNVAYLKRVSLVPGAVAIAYGPQDIQKELARAQRQYCKTFSQGTATAQSVGSLGGAIEAMGTSGVAMATSWRFPVEMRAAPTVVTYNPFAADANWRDRGNTVSETAAIESSGRTGVGIYATSHVNDIAGVIHASASARLS